jgi:hypothetical protein
MFRVNTTRRNVKRAASPIRPATDVSGNLVFYTPPPAQPTPLAAIVEPPATPHALEKSILNLLDAETSATMLTKPWLRLERGIRLQKYRAFAEVFPGLSPEERTSLYDFLVKANDAKQLNTKTVIQYEAGKIVSIKGLKIIRIGDPSKPAVFKIDAGRQTKRNTATEDS